MFRLYRNSGGFTLLELVISITLISIIIVILSMSIRTGLRAYMRGREANRYIVTVSAIRGLLSRQIIMAVRPGTGNLEKYFRFRGEKDELVFVTTHVPMGAQAAGIFLVAYRFQDGEDFMVYGQRIVTSVKDIRQEFPGRISLSDIKNLRKDGWDVSIIPGIKSVSFSYLGRDGEMEVDSVDNWPSAWNRDQKLPRAVGLILEFQNKKREVMFFEIPDRKTVTRKNIFGP